MNNSSSLSAIILCAGKGTRMNDNSKNKVCFECAGKPVIRRIIENMKAGGVSRFVLVVGHQAQSVMDALDGVDGIAYAYQKEQRGTGDAVRCGVRTLHSLGFSGKVIVSMGDKIIRPDVISRLVSEASQAPVIWGVQPLANNPGGGRIIIADGRPYGVVELADVAYQTLAGLPQDEWQSCLEAQKLNATKCRKVMKRAENRAPAGFVELGGRRFSASELQKAIYSNAGFYCFDTELILDALSHIGSDNAQGEVYLTDALELFAKEGQAKLFVIEDKPAMLTFSTKQELRSMSRHFLRKASDYLADAASGRLEQEIQGIYGDEMNDGQLSRYRKLLEAFIERYGDTKVVISRAPGRVNLMGRHIDHRGGNTNVMAVGCDILMVASPREDDVVRIANLDGNFPPAEFSISAQLALASDAEGWLEYLEAPAVRGALAKNQGNWMNYIMGVCLRLQRAMDISLCGMDVMVDGNIPPAAGLSSSSALVVAACESLVGLNCLNLTARQFVELCGEAEWFVGSRGGANDHAAMKFARRGQIVHLGFLPFTIGESYEFSDKYAVLVADSLQQARKSEGSRDIFNARVAAYEIGFMLMQSRFPQRGWRVFRELSEIEPVTDIYQMLATIPERVTRQEAFEMLPAEKKRLKQIFMTHADPGSYELRGVLLYGVSECLRARLLGDYLKEGDYHRIGELMNISHDGDRLPGKRYDDERLAELSASSAEVILESGAYACSTERVDRMCDLLNSLPGVLGSSITGAGLGGAVVALVERTQVQDVIQTMQREFYGPQGLPLDRIKVFASSAGSCVLY